MNVKIELIKDHEHDGRQYAAGAPLELDADTARWLIEQGVARATANQPKRSKQQED